MVYLLGNKKSDSLLSRDSTEGGRQGPSPTSIPIVKFHFSPFKNPEIFVFVPAVKHRSTLFEVIISFEYMFKELKWTGHSLSNKFLKQEDLNNLFVLTSFKRFNKLEPCKLVFVLNSD
uniref:Uncharacterized protein n=1 Tax=Gossypium raimondii TaxID=29730 RepID=A0A0D2U583_GOSRA|nr:hypothetical protein B456_010G030800 [Gossypium raimondii]